MKLLLRKVSFGYSADQFALSEIDLAIESGESVAIVGPSGCGKTTLLRILAGLLQDRLPSEAHLSGSIQYGDAWSLNGLRLKHKIGYMFQTPILFPFLTVRSNVAFSFGNGQRDLGLVRTDALLDKMGLRSRAECYPSSLSGGMQTRVALARTFAPSPQLLLMDEPFGSLDIAWRLSLYNELVAMRSGSGATTVLVTHDLEEALILGTRIIVMGTNGRIATEMQRSGNPDEILDLDRLRAFLAQQRETIARMQDQISKDVVTSRKLN